jgi:hypothetical protein
MLLNIVMAGLMAAENTERLLKTLFVYHYVMIYKIELKFNTPVIRLR